MSSVLLTRLGRAIVKPERPLTLALASGGLVAFAAELAFRGSRTIVEGTIAGTPFPSNLGLGLIAGMIVLAVAVVLISAALVWFGVRGSGVFATVIAVWQISGHLYDSDVLAWVLGLVPVVVIVTVWLPPSASFRREARRWRASESPHA